MPLYEYRCTKCGHQFEVLQKFSDPPRRRCTECSGKLEKLISRTSFHLKGGGWFAQGYGDTSGGKGASGNGASGGSGGSPEKKGGADKGSGGESKPSASKASAATA